MFSFSQCISDKAIIWGWGRVAGLGGSRYEAKGESLKILMCQMEGLGNRRSCGRLAGSFESVCEFADHEFKASSCPVYFLSTCVQLLGFGPRERQ